MRSKELKVEKARDLGRLFSRNDARMIGQDGAYSVPINSEESLWLFGDTFIGTFDENGRRRIERMPNNTGLICRSRVASSGLTDFTYLKDRAGEIRQLIPLLPAENPDVYRIWGMDGCMIGEKIFWFYIRIRILPELHWPFKFEPAGSGLAMAESSDFIFNRIKIGGTTVLWDEKLPCFGVSVLCEKRENFAYIYGSTLKQKKQYCVLARGPMENLTDLSRYEYFVSSEPRWSPESEKAQPIMEGMPTEMSVSFNSYLDCYLAVHSWETTGQLVGRTAPFPWGPWSEPVHLWNSKVGLRNPLVYDGPIVYAGKEHPELSKENGKIIYLTCVEFEEYFPRLIEVVLQ